MENCYRDNCFKDKNIFITGSTGNIGSAIAKRFANLGAFVSVCGRNREQIQSIVQYIEDSGGNCIGIELDVSNNNSINNAIAKFLKATDNRIDGLINCAGGGPRENRATLENQTIDMILKIINTNLIGTILCTKECIPYISDGGFIINFSSVIGHMGMAEYSEYAAAKAGIIGFTKAIAKELGSRSIRVNSVSYGMVSRYGKEGKSLIEHQKTNYLNAFMMGEDVTGIIMFLASEEASYITGADILVDGGRVLALRGTD
ncbi:MAG: SDR family oxidoreductase [Lachnospiraceae bacterium]|nr:SDR family oxidoreductase [Lachnospiraceae bacterium]